MDCSLYINDKVKVTTVSGDLYNAIVLDISEHDLFLKLAGFGKLNIAWRNISLIDKIITPSSRGDSYGPSYIVHVYQNNDTQMAAS